MATPTHAPAGSGTHPAVLAGQPGDASTPARPGTESPSATGRPAPRNAMFDCGWGRLIFADTFTDNRALAEALRAESPDRRDIAFHVKEPHLLLAAAPQELFLDPSNTYRLTLADYQPSDRRPTGLSVRRLSTREDAEAVNIIYASRQMVTVPPDFFWSRRNERALTVLVAEDDDSGEILGTVTGVDHTLAIGDQEGRTSLWCLAVAPDARHPGIGEALIRALIEQYIARHARTLELSVMHDNEQATRLYEKLGFVRVPVFTAKRKNPINESLFTGPASAEDDKLNPYARIIVREARRRGIGVEVVDAEGGFFRLDFGGRSVVCRESLSEFTSGVAMSICDDKSVTRRIVARAGVRVPPQIAAGDDASLRAFLEEHQRVVVKPARGEQGRGIAVGLTSVEETRAAIENARRYCADVLVEACVDGVDLRLVVIDYRVVAAAIRRPAQISGDGEHTIRQLIETQSRRRAAATGGESTIPIDGETERVVAGAGYGLDDVAPAGETITVRKTANLHTGGTITDVTAETHPTLIDAAIRAARAIEIPVTGIDLMVRDPRQPDYWFIEANERPGLANHEPQPTAERFVDLLFPLSVPRAARMVGQRRRPAADAGTPPGANA